MWPFRKRPTLEESGFFQGFTDWHSHILPGVDDGVQTLEESLRVLDEYERLGVREVWLTPHIMEDIPNTTAHLRQRFQELQAAYSQGVPGNPAVETHSCVSANKNTSHPLASSNVVETHSCVSANKNTSHPLASSNVVEAHSCVSSEETAASSKLILHLAAENMLDSLFEERLEQNDLLPIGPNGDHLLVETSYFSPPMGMRDILQRVQAKGYHPVLAHPERYLYMTDHAYRQLKDMGVKFQLNQFSLYGLYGKEAQKRAIALRKMDMYDYVGTDLHRLNVLRQALRWKA